MISKIIKKITKKKIKEELEVEKKENKKDNIKITDMVEKLKEGYNDGYWITKSKTNCYIQKYQIYFKFNGINCYVSSNVRYDKSDNKFEIRFGLTKRNQGVSKEELTKEIYKFFNENKKEEFIKYLNKVYEVEELIKEEIFRTSGEYNKLYKKKERIFMEDRYKNEKQEVRFRLELKEEKVFLESLLYAENIKDKNILHFYFTPNKHYKIEKNILFYLKKYKINLLLNYNHTFKSTL